VKVFVSYSRRDEVIAHLLAHILRANDIECLIDRELRAGQEFDSRLQQMIKEADLVLVLLTKDASRSAWVNQEIGFAKAHGKTVWPLAIEADIEPHGMLSTTQAYSLVDWSHPTLTIQRLVAALQSGVSETADPYRQFGFDQVIEGKIARTRFLVDRLNELRRRGERRLVVLNQAAFSIFAASDEPMYREAGGHSAEYMELLLAERRTLEELTSMPDCSFRLILWPVRAYEAKHLAMKFTNLLSWMEKVQDQPGIQYACGPYPGPNRLIIMGKFLIEGFKLHNHPGYEMTVVRYQPDQIERAAAQFQEAFGRSGDNKETARKRVRQMYEMMRGSR